MKIYESFKWVPTSAKVMPTDTKAVKFKVVLARAGDVSGNGRQYVREELRKAARTLSGKPINWNHTNKIIGTIDFADFDETDDQLEAVGFVNNAMYADRIRSNDPSWKGWSIQADYYTHECAQCHKTFESDEMFRNHFLTEHGYKNTIISQPLGIHFNALAYVEDPEVPGLPSKTEIMETQQLKGLSELCESIIHDYEKIEESKRMSKIVSSVKKEEATAVSIAPKIAEVKIALKEQEDMPEHECPDGEHWDIEQEKCVVNVVTEQEHECPDGEHWSEIEGKCVTNKVEEQDEPDEPTKHECPDGEHWSEEQGKCIPIGLVTEHSKLPVLEHVAPSLVTLREIKGLEKLSLAEPCDWSKFGYSSFDDCVASNSDKGDPETYCGSLKAKEKLEVARYNKVVEAVNKVLVEIQKPIQIKDFAPTIVAINKAFSQIKEAIAKIPKDDLSWKEIKDDLSWKTAIANLPKDDDSWKPRIVALEQKEIPQDDKSWIVKCATKEELTPLKETVTQDHERLETLLTKLDPVVTRLNEAETKAKDLEKKLGETEKTLKETVEKAETAKTLSENTEAKLKGNFKGAHQKPETEKLPLQNDPAKGGKY